MEQSSMRRTNRTLSFLRVLFVLLAAGMLTGCATMMYQPSQQVLGNVSVVDAKNTVTELYRQNIPNGTLTVHADRLEFSGRHFNGTCLYEAIPDPKVDDYGGLAGQYHIGDRYMVDIGRQQNCTMIMFSNYDSATAFANALYVLKYTPLQVKMEQLQPSAVLRQGGALRTARSVQPVRSDQDAAVLPEAPVEGREVFEAAKKANTLETYGMFLKAYPYSPNRPAALQAMAGIIEQQNGSYEDFRKFVVAYEDGLEYVPEKYRLLLTGPEGLRVGDIVALRKKRVGDNILAAKVRSSKGKYKDFSFAEIDALGKIGIPGIVIEAMIDSTARATREAEELQKKKDMENLLAEIQRMQQKLQDMKSAAASGAIAAAPVVAGTGQAPKAADTLQNCTAQIAALEACKHLPSIGAMVCKATAKAQFPCE